MGMLMWQLLLNNALRYGLALSLVLVAIMAVSLVLAPDMWVGDYPPDIRDRYGPMSPRAARLRPFIAIPFFLASLVVPLLALDNLESKVGSVPFLPALASSFIVLLTFNLFDLLIADWLIFCTLRPKAIVLPGTEGLAGYRDYRFHFIGFLKGLVFCLVGSLVVTALWFAGQAILG
jgi:hypothetical protein